MVHTSLMTNKSTPLLKKQNPTICLEMRADSSDEAMANGATVSRDSQPKLNLKPEEVC